MTSDDERGHILSRRLVNYISSCISNNRNLEKLRREINVASNIRWISHPLNKLEDREDREIIECLKHNEYLVKIQNINRAYRAYNSALALSNGNPSYKLMKSISEYLGEILIKTTTDVKARKLKNY